MRPKNPYHFSSGDKKRPHLLQNNLERSELCGVRLHAIVAKKLETRLTQVKWMINYDDHRVVDENSSSTKRELLTVCLNLRMTEVWSMLLDGRSIDSAFRKTSTTRVKVFGCVRTKALLSI